MIFNQCTKAAEKVCDASKFNTMVLKLVLDELLKVLTDYKPASMWRAYDFSVHLLKSTVDTSGFKSLIHIIMNAILKITVESFVESEISTYEDRFGSRQARASEAHHFSELLIYKRGPPIVKAKSLLMAALNKHFGGSVWEAHYKDKNTPLGKDGTVLTRLKCKKTRIPWME